LVTSPSWNLYRNCHVSHLPGSVNWAET